MAQLSTKQWAQIISDIVAAEGPIHEEEAFRCCTSFFGARASARPREAFDRGLGNAIAAGALTRKGEFLWPPGQTTVNVRYRGGECPVTRPELIAPEEFDAAVRLVLEQQFGVKFDALIEATARLFGFARTGSKLKAAFEQALVRLDQRGEIKVDDSQYVTLSPQHSA